jgi:hypothetical protein
MNSGSGSGGWQLELKEDQVVLLMATPRGMRVEEPSGWA